MKENKKTRGVMYRFPDDLYLVYREEALRRYGKRKVTRLLQELVAVFPMLDGENDTASV